MHGKTVKFTSYRTKKILKLRNISFFEIYSIDSYFDTSRVSYIILFFLVFICTFSKVFWLFSLFLSMLTLMSLIDNMKVIQEIRELTYTIQIMYHKLIQNYEMHYTQR